MRATDTKSNPNDIKKAVTAAYAGYEMAAYMGINPLMTLDEIIDQTRGVPYSPSRPYTQAQLLPLFDSLIEGPYDMDVVLRISGLNESGYQQYRVTVHPGWNMNNVKEEVLEQLFEEYDITGPHELDIDTNYIVGYILP